jgi:hypothetical protein
MSNDIVAKFRDGKRVEAAIQESLRQVRILHKRMGVPLVGSVDGKLVSIPPEEIVIDDPLETVVPPYDGRALHAWGM